MRMNIHGWTCLRSVSVSVCPCVFLTHFILWHFILHTPDVCMLDDTCIVPTKNGVGSRARHRNGSVRGGACVRTCSKLKHLQQTSKQAQLGRSCLGDGAWARAGPAHAGGARSRRSWTHQPSSRCARRWTSGHGARPVQRGAGHPHPWPALRGCGSGRTQLPDRESEPEVEQAEAHRHSQGTSCNGLPCLTLGRQRHVFSPCAVASAPSPWRGSRT